MSAKIQKIYSKNKRLRCFCTNKSICHLSDSIVPLFDTPSALTLMSLSHYYPIRHIPLLPNFAQSRLAERREAEGGNVAHLREDTPPLLNRISIGNHDHLPPTQTLQSLAREVVLVAHRNPQHPSHLTCPDYRILRTYMTKYGCRNITQIIMRWAPPSENNTSAYVQKVSQMAKIHPLDRLDFGEEGQMIAIVRAMAYVENGVIIEGDSIRQGYRMATL